MIVPFFDYPKLFKQDQDALIEIFNDVGERGAFILQRDLTEFEHALAKFIDVKHTIGVANGTDGLELIWMALGIKPNDEVIISSHTMLATASSIKIAGGVPVPVDIGSDGLIDPKAVSAAITSNTVGVMPTDLNGRTCKMDKIMSLANKHGLFVVEDAAQALGSRYKNQHAGTFGNAAAISFFPAKVLGCLGDAGGIITNNDTIFEKCFQLHDHGRDTNGDVKSWGRNSRLDNLQAAILNYKLKTYDKVITRRREIAKFYHSQLKDLEFLKLPPEPVDGGDHFDVYQNFEIQIEKRDLLRDYLSAKNVGTLIQWGGKAVHQWDELGFNLKLPDVEDFFEKCLMLPINMFISDSDIEYVCETIKSFFDNGS